MGISEDNARKLRDIEAVGIRRKGQRELIDHLNGKILSKRAAILANCYECEGYCADGQSECTISGCPLYPHSQFNPNRIKISRPGSGANFKKPRKEE